MGSRNTEDSNLDHENQRKQHPHQPLVFDLEVEVGWHEVGDKAHGAGEDQLDGEGEVNLHDEAGPGLPVEAVVEVGECVVCVSFVGRRGRRV